MLFKETRKELVFVHLHGSLMGIADQMGLPGGNCVQAVHQISDVFQYSQPRVTSTWSLRSHPLSLRSQSQSCDCLHQDKKGSKINKYFVIFYVSGRKETNMSWNIMRTWSILMLTGIPQSLARLWLAYHHLSETIHLS